MANIAQQLLEQFPDRLVTIDSHTAGEPTRLIVGGVPPIPGETIADKRLYLMREWDHIRLQLTSEPRGHRDMIAALVTEPTTEGADFGLIYMDARRYPYLCGHATIGAVTTLVEAGAVEAVEPETLVTIDTPSGPATAVAHVQGQKVESVTIRLSPSFVYGENQPLNVPGLGRIQVDTVCVGGFFAMVSAEQIGLALKPENAGRLIELGMAIIESANEQLTVCHPARPEVTTVDVTEFYDLSGHRQGRGLSAVIYGESHIDRSPCGTGTSAKMALLHHRGQLALNQPYINAGILGTTFEGRLVAETMVGDPSTGSGQALPAVVPEVRGSAHVTGVHQFVLDPRDPFPRGFLL
ncbi:MAG: proline racemase family protein [Anaerolineae bacterium]|nr:proline racemase family protein [Anaerolineae bacterium]